MTVEATGTPQFQLTPLTRHSRRHSVELRLLDSHCAHRKLAAIKKAVIQAGRSQLNIKEIGFPRKSESDEKQPGGTPKRDMHLLVIETTVLASSGTTVQEVLEDLFEALSPIVAMVVQDVDVNVVAQVGVAPAVIVTRTAKAQVVTVSKQKKRKLHELRCSKEAFRQRRIAACDAFRDGVPQDSTIDNLVARITSTTSLTRTERAALREDLQLIPAAV